MTPYDTLKTLLGKGFLDFEWFHRDHQRGLLHKKGPVMRFECDKRTDNSEIYQ